MTKNKCKHNWHLVGVETFKNVVERTTQYAHFICDECGKTKVTKVDGYLNKVILNKDKE